MGGGVKMELQQTDVEFRVVCECGSVASGDSMNDVVLNWTAHVAATSEHREAL